MTEQQQGAPGGGADGAARPRHPDDARSQGQAPPQQGQAPPQQGQAAPQQGAPQGQAPPQQGGPQAPAQGQGPGGGGGTGGPPPAGSYAQAHGDGVGTGSGGKDEQHVRVLDETRAQDLRNRWNGVQAAFVDEPRQAVTDADQLVGEVLDEVSRAFREQRASLEQGWGGQDAPGTEDLRQALFRYREFFDRLLSL